MALGAPPLPAFKIETIEARALAEACSEPDQIAKVLGFKHPLGHPTFGTFNSVYVVSPKDLEVSKVGIAGDIPKRLNGLQCGNWNKLYVRALFWCVGAAYELETSVLRKLKKFGVRLEGEWAGISAEDMALLVAKCAKEIAMPIATSQMYMDHWIEYAGHRWATMKAEANVPRPH